MTDNRTDTYLPDAEGQWTGDDLLALLDTWNAGTAAGLSSLEAARAALVEVVTRREFLEKEAERCRADATHQRS